MLRTINLYGALAKETGVSNIQLDVNSPRELFAGLRSQVPNFREALMNCPTVAVVLSNEDKTVVSGLSADEIEFSLGKNASNIHIFAEESGAGIELAVIAAMGLTAGTAAAIVVGIVVNLAIGLVVGAIASALAPSPGTSEGGARAEQRPSFLFNGAVNVVDQGYAVPLVYGVHSVGSVVVSAGTDVAEMPYATAIEAPPANGGGTTQPAVPPVETFQWAGGNP